MSMFNFLAKVFAKTNTTATANSTNTRRYAVGSVGYTAKGYNNPTFAVAGATRRRGTDSSFTRINDVYDFRYGQLNDRVANLFRI